MTIAFWNVNKKELSDLLVTFTKENDVDILILAEAEPDMLLKYFAKINSASKSSQYNQIFCKKDKLIIISRYTITSFEDKSDVYTNTRMVANKFKITGIIELNIIGLHFHSKNNWADISQSMECATISQEIKNIEQNTKNLNTIVIGDFNMNPFESGMVAANGFHAVADFDCVTKYTKGRNIDDNFYQYFYNPMWNFFGDHKKPLGTYYYKSSGNVSYDWHIFDQVLIRSSIKQYLQKDYIKIIDKIGLELLTTNLGRPDKVKYSDHLPITLKLKI